MDGQPATDEDRGQPVRAVLADADQAELRATSEIGRSKNEADVDRAIQRAREAVQAALRNTRSQSVRRSLETKLRIIERQAADRKQTIKLEYWDARSHSQLDRLNDADLRAISLITHFDGRYLQVNGALREGTISDIEGIAEQSHDVSQAIAKLDSYPGVVYRQLPDRLSADQLARYAPGQTIVENAYTHASMDPDFKHGSGNVAFLIESKSARLVGRLSVVKYEREVMFDRFTRFLVVDKESDENDNWTIVLREL